jgi:protein TonB
MDENNEKHTVVPRKKNGKNIRNYYGVIFEAGLLLALVALIALARMPIQLDDEFVIPDYTPDLTVAVEEIEQTEQLEKPPPPPRPPVPIEVPNDVLLDETILDIDAEIDFDEPAALPPPPPPPAEVEEIEEEPDIFVVVEEEPVLLGGIGELQKMIEYPEIAKRAGIQGMVVVQFVVDENGHVVDPVVVKSVGGGCDEEALRVVKLAKFKPGKQRGKAVKVRFSIPIRFKLFQTNV